MNLINCNYIQLFTGCQANNGVVNTGTATIMYESDVPNIVNDDDFFTENNVFLSDNSNTTNLIKCGKVVITDGIKLKVIKPIGCDCIKFYNKNEAGILTLLYTHLYYTISGLDVQPQKEIYYYCLVTLYQSKTDISEIIYHENAQNAHLSKPEYLVYLDIKDDKLISKNAVDSIVSNTKGEVINENLISTDFQIFYLGNLLNDRFNMQSGS